MRGAGRSSAPARPGTTGVVPPAAAWRQASTSGSTRRPHAAVRAGSWLDVGADELGEQERVDAHAGAGRRTRRRTSRLLDELGDDGLGVDELLGGRDVLAGALVGLGAGDVELEALVQLDQQLARAQRLQRLRGEAAMRAAVVEREVANPKAAAVVTSSCACRPASWPDSQLPCDWSLPSATSRPENCRCRVAWRSSRRRSHDRICVSRSFLVRSRPWMAEVRKPVPASVAESTTGGRAAAGEPGAAVDGADERADRAGVGGERGVELRAVQHEGAVAGGLDADARGAGAAERRR